MSGAATRMFVAVTPPPAVVEALEEFLAPRREHGRFRWTLPETWHVTLAFCPAVPDRVLDDLADRLERAAHKRRAIPAEVAGGGAFPNVARGRVLWAGLDLAPDDAEELRRLATGARAAVTKAGADVDGERFRPHLTLARMNGPAELTSWVRLLDAYRSGPFVLEELQLVASYLGEGPRGRPRYETVGTWPLGAWAESR